MIYGYSDDLRRSALSYYDQGVATQREVSEIFGISLRTFSTWVRLRKTGDISRRPHAVHKRPHKIDDARLSAYIREHPDAYLRELGEVFGVSDVAILKACRRLGISRKKNRAISGEGRG